MPIRYTREALLRLRAHASSDPIVSDFAVDTRCFRRPRKRGRRGGAVVRARRRRHRLPLPSIVFGNVQSVRNKIDECLASVQHLREYRDVNLLCLSESWLTEDDGDPDLPGFTVVRLDRTREDTGKSRGGGVCMFVSDKWCTNITVKEKVCCENIELLTVALRPFYLPREFNQLFVTVLYIHPKADAKVACSMVAEVVHRLASQSPDAPCLVLGDFNHCKLNQTLPHFKQYVKCPTHKDKTIDLCYGNIHGAYSSKPLPCLGRSPHNMVQLVPTYRQRLKREKPIVREVKKWTSDSSEALSDCFESTDWSVFADPSLDTTADVTSAYIAFCAETVLETKSCTVFPNNKPWVTPGLKRLLYRKKEAFKSGDRDEVKTVQRQLNRQIREDKRRFATKLENNFKEGNSRQYWQDVQTITGYKPKKVPLKTTDEAKLAGELNTFYARFDQRDFSEEQLKVMEEVFSRPSTPVTITTDEVRASFKKVKARSAAGPDNITGRLLRECGDSLAPVYRELFQRSLDEHSIPAIWKSSTIVPVPKKRAPATMNDYRPVALTSIPFKCAEKLVLRRLRSETDDHQDPLQFAYARNRSTEDAILTLVHNVSDHLEKPSSYARILFIDFSSAFNTIQPHLMMRKLLEFDVNPVLISWVFSFLTKRTQRVRVGQVLSDAITTNTGAPQGCVLSPTLFTLYTADCRLRDRVNLLLKFADDTSLSGLILKNDELAYRNAVEELVKWCDNNFLELNVTKTKELIMDFRRNKNTVDPIVIKGEPVEMVDTYKYLGTIIDNQLDWSPNVDAVCKRANQRLFFLRKLRQFRVNPEILHLFYQATIQSVASFNQLCYHSSVKKGDRERLEKVVKRAGAIIGSDLQPLSARYPSVALRKMSKIRSDDRHPLHQAFASCEPTREASRRLRCWRARTNRMRDSFVPTAVRLFNESL